jgi:enoyl-CoA hydratase/carnithine racemase
VRRRATAPARRHGLDVRVAAGVAWLRLERPAAGNRITAELAQALCDAAAEIELDDRVAVVVLAAGGDSFCLGVEDGGEWERRVDWVDAIGRLTRPVIAAVHGDAIGEGLELALACDVRLVSSGARCALPQLTHGRLPVHGGTQRLPRLVGRMRALDLVWTGRSVDASEAEAIGLASRVAAPEAFGAALDALVGALQSKGPIALRYAKEAVLKGSDLTLEQGTHLEEDLYVLLQTTHDRREGIDAFLTQRAPVFTGQ